MPILVSCDCGKKFRVGDELAGKRIRCIACKEIVRVPDADGDESSGAAAAAPSRIAQGSPPAKKSEEDAEPLKLADEEEKPGRSKSDDDDRPRRKRGRDDDFDYGDDEDEDRAPRKRKKKRRRRGSGFSGIPDEILGIDTFLFGLLVAGGLAGVGLVMALVFPVLAILPHLLGLVMALAGTIWFLVIAFQDEVLYGIMCLCVPFYSLIYLFSNWETTQRPFFLGLLGHGIMWISMCIGGYGPSFGPGPGPGPRHFNQRF